MDKCPKCHEMSLVFDPYSKMAKCLRLDCMYREVIDHAKYSTKFQGEDKVLEHQLSLSLETQT